MKKVLLFMLVIFSNKLFAQCTPASISITAFGTVCPNSSYTLHVDLNNDPSLTYEWQRNGVVVVTGSTSIAYPYNGNTLLQGDVITCIKTNNTTGCQDTATYTVNYKDGFTLSLSSNPSGTVAAGTSVVFTSSQFTATYPSTFTFYVNGASVYSVYNEGPTNTYTTSTLNNGDILYATVQHSPVSNPCGMKNTSNIIVMYINGVLPISLSGFSVTASQNNFLLNWSTESETNSAYFNVQESTDGQTFTTVGKVTATGNSAIIQRYAFNFKPESVSNNPFYFRLQMVDKDGSVSYSSIQKASLANNFSVAISPNPATNFVYVSGNGIKQIQILNMAGKLVYNKTNIVDNSPVDVSALARGMYLLRIENAEGKIVLQKIILQ